MFAEKGRSTVACKFFQRSGEVSPKQHEEVAPASKRSPEEKKSNSRATTEYTFKCFKVDVKVKIFQNGSKVCCSPVQLPLGFGQAFTADHSTQQAALRNSYKQDERS